MINGNEQCSALSQWLLLFHGSDASIGGRRKTNDSSLIVRSLVEATSFPPLVRIRIRKAFYQFVRILNDVLSVDSALVQLGSSASIVVVDQFARRTKSAVSRPSDRHQRISERKFHSLRRIVDVDQGVVLPQFQSIFGFNPSEQRSR